MATRDHTADGDEVTPVPRTLTIEATCVVAPLREAGRYTTFPSLTPSVEIDGTAWIVRVQELAAVPGAELRERAGSLAAHRDPLKRALDILIYGV